MSKNSVLIATDNSIYAPALHLADKKYIVPLINDPTYIDVILDICKKERIQAITTFIDPEIALLSRNRDKFEAVGVEVLLPYEDTAELCFDKYEMFKFLTQKGIKTPLTYVDLDAFREGYEQGIINFPVFVKPRTGSGSVGARKVSCLESLINIFEAEPGLIIQEFMDCEDLDADVYVDTITHKAISIFTKKKIETKIGGANKTISFKDEKLFSFIKKIVGIFKFNGPIDMDFFYKDGSYYLSEINPRFGGAYLHAYGAGVDFVKLIENNIQGKQNQEEIGYYDDDIVMMMYDSVVIKPKSELNNLG